MNREAAQPEQAENIGPWFKHESLELLREQLTLRSYPGYPTSRLSYRDGAQTRLTSGAIYLPDGPWSTAMAQETTIDMSETLDFAAKGFLLDHLNRPVHPWIQQLLADDIGVVTNKGFYRHWGPNYTADPVIIRTDTDEPLLLLVQRKDTLQWALAGGFVEPGETGTQAALREACEETSSTSVQRDWEQYNPRIETVYSGLLADIRFTANAWPETEAVGVFLDPRLTHGMSTEPFIGNTEEVTMCAWFSAEQAKHDLFGSHKLLAELALNKM